MLEPQRPGYYQTKMKPNATKTNQNHNEKNDKNLHRPWQTFYFICTLGRKPSPRSAAPFMGAPQTASVLAFADGTRVGPLCASAFGIGGQEEAGQNEVSPEKVNLLSAPAFIQDLAFTNMKL